jgi:hypothetical protein
MHPQYFIAGERLFAFNPKAGSSAIVRGIVAQYYPEIEKSITEAHYPTGRSADTDQHHSLLPFRINPDRPVVQVVRCPVERFRSAMAQLQLQDVDKTLHELHAEEGWGSDGGPRLAGNIHMMPQTRFVGDITYFSISRVVDAAEALGITCPLKRINESQEKPELTGEQAERVRQWYADDVELWERVR